MDVRLLLLLFFLVSCLPQAQVSSGRISQESGNTGGSSSGTGGGVIGSDNGWNYLGKVSKSITINVSNLNVAYVIGTNVESFLAASGNIDADFCLISRYVVGTGTKEMRNKVVPISYYDFTQKRTVRILRVDFPEATSSADVCGASQLKVLSSDGNLVDEGLTYSLVYRPGDVCPTCTSIQQSYKNMLTIKNATSGKLEELAVAKIDFRGLSLAVDPNNNSNTNGGTCSKDDCQTRGYDCCLDNQCVKDGAARPAALTQFATQYQVAEVEKLQNPLAYLNYPHIYYICAGSVSTTGGTSGGGGTKEDGVACSAPRECKSAICMDGKCGANIEKLKKDYYCIQNLKNNKTSETFHMDLQTVPTPFPHLTAAGSECYTTSMAGNTMHYWEVVKRLYTTCGCAKTTIPDMVNYCPAYDYVITTADSQGNPLRIDCYTPPNTGGGTVNNQNVNLNSRSAPHRFFDAGGTERDILSTTTTYTQEGTDNFEYLDDGYLLPDQDEFSMKAVLGEFKVSLDVALPAKTVNVELDQVYTISTTSGYYTPCPTCSKDQWLTSFSAFPVSAYGVGLQSIGHTTARDEFSTNTTGGNYEDTIFGRACWLPPTMLPFSHLPSSSISNGYSDTIQRQRINRLKTQAALYINGYQRDWWGFNKGAVIGSFDGVTWFAIGKGRIVKSTTKKLYLAINAPFADLASPTLHVVNVQAYDGITTAAQFDYDPQYSLSHPYQNEAGNCQANHLCASDTDCITRLGWEYMCADVRDVKTNWPRFDANGKEVNDGTTSANIFIDQILQQKRFPSANTKRCVYRGAGAPCIVNSANIGDTNKRKTLTCAPNFYCANVGSTGAFNDKVARYGANIEDIPLSRNHLFGKDANVLGRPLHYVANTSSVGLPSDVQSTLRANISAYDSNGLTNSGVCQPGKSLPSASNFATFNSPYVQHQSKDSTGRTDFINQIASCNSTLFNSARYSSCPVVGTDGNYEMFQAGWTPSLHQTKSLVQNSCGLDSLHSSAALTSSADALWQSYTPFKNIEARTLATSTVVNPTLARDACLRRAGQVCHTDLDCGPNKFHAEQTDYFGVNYFGNAAEKSYYQESLVCGQADPKPLQSQTVAFRNYNMASNRCCREIGLDLTTFTSDVPINTIADLPADYQTATFDLRGWMTPGTTPNDPKRYSRLASVNGLVPPNSVISTTTKPPLSAYQVQTGLTLGKRQDNGTGTTASVGVNVATPYQWSTLGDANSNTCCGKGWIRKFADGTTDWTRRDRVFMDVANFRCINSKTVLLTHPAAVQTAAYISPVATLVSLDYNDYCKDNTGANASCAMWTIDNSLTGSAPIPPIGMAPNPATNYSSFYLTTVNPQFNSYRDYYFMPKSADNNTSVVIDYGVTTGRRNFNLIIPSFVPQIDGSAAFDEAYDAGSLYVRMYNYPGAATSFTCSKWAGGADPAASATTEFASAACAGQCCYWRDTSTPNVRRLRVMLDISHLGVTPAAWASKQIGVEIKSTGGALFRSAGQIAGITRTSPGDNTYYSKRLGKFELSGIPQITYEPLYCNDNRENLVPGLFKNTVANKTNFELATNSFLHPDGSYRTNRYGLSHDPVFSEADFKCCAQLGKVAASADKCCSGFGVPNGSQVTCKLPAGANLSVYFNRFVSNEGRETTQPGGGFVDTDFDPETGEPKVLAPQMQKVAALGVAYCEIPRVRQGGAFGSFPLEPMGQNTSITERIYGIVDSSNDIGQTSNSGGTVEVGYMAFMNGFRWNHHLYCADE